MPYNVKLLNITFATFEVFGGNMYLSKEISLFRCIVSLFNSQSIIIYFKIPADMAKEEGTNLDVVER